MKDEQLKREMMNLWKETFGDSDDYIELVFDSYFTPRNVAYRLDEEGKLMAAMLGVPYDFSGFESEEKCGKLRGMYLCGLSTRPEYRGQGIMSELLNEMNIRAESDGFDFTFLIPANEGLVKYYFDRGYVESFYRNEFRYTSAHDFRKELLVREKDSESVFDNLKVRKVSLSDASLVEKVIDFIQSEEKKDRVVGINHSSEDLKTTIKERFVSEGDVVCVLDEKDNIIGVAFYSFTDENEVKIDCILYEGKVVKYKLLQAIKDEYSDKCILCLESAEVAKVDNQALWKPYYIGSPEMFPNLHSVSTLDVPVDEKELSKSYGMVRLLNADKVIKYVAELNNLQTGEEVEKMMEDMRGYKKCGIKTLEEFLFRHPHDEDALYLMLNFPRLPLRMSLMLD